MSSNKTNQGGSIVQNPNLSGGSPVKDDTFPEYGLKTVPVLNNGNDTGRRFIFRDNEFVADVTSRYNLIPNEKVLEIADEIADELGAEPFCDFDGDWYMELDDHAVTDREGRRLHAMYAWSEDTVQGDEMQYGFIVHNSIDKSLGFSVGLFTFRHACSNMVWMAAGKGQNRGMDFDDRNVLESYYHKHTSGLETEASEVKELIRQTVGKIPEVHETYEEWAQTGVTIEDVKRLRDRLPHSDFPDWVDEAVKAIEDLREDLDEDEELSETQKDAEFLDKLPSGETTWDLYNDLTESAWHGDTSDQTKRKKNKDIHRTLAPAQGVR